MFPSFNEIIAVLVTAIVLTTASGHGDLVWKGIAGLRRVAMTQAKQDWGCPSIFNKHACRR